MSTIDRYKQDLEKLIDEGGRLQLDLEIRAAGQEVKFAAKRKELGLEPFERNYQSWYSEALTLLSELLPHRTGEFAELYRRDPKRKFVNVETFSVQDWLLGMRSADSRGGGKLFADIHVVCARVSNQQAILKSASRRFESSLFDIKQMLRADLFDSELDAADELLGNGFLRPAGALAGVVLERHLGIVCDARKCAPKKSHPTISSFNDELKNAGVLDTPTWRSIQHLGDLRNLCDHAKGREPTKEEIVELIAGARKITKNVF